MTRRVRAALLAGVCSLGVAAPADAARPACPLVVDAAGDVAPQLVVSAGGDEGGLDILAADVSAGPMRLSTTIWLERLDGAVPTSGTGHNYEVRFRVGRATLFTRVFHWPLNTDFSAGWIDEDGQRRRFRATRAGGAYDAEIGMLRVSFDTSLIREDPIPGDPVIRAGTVISGVVVEAHRDELTTGPTVADAATGRAAYRVGQKACPPYRTG